MRLTLWIVPTIVFVVAAFGIVGREAKITKTPATAAPSIDGAAGQETAPAIAPAESNRLSVQATTADFEPLQAPAFREPVWKIIDHGFPGEVVPTSDIPVLAISNTTTTAADAVPPVQIAANDKPRPAPPWEVIGHSIGGLPIHIRRYGSTGEATLIVCGLDGTDRIAVKWLDELSQQLNDSPELVNDRRIILLRDPNPDGLTAKQQANKHGVVLNRNFPSARYRPGAEAGPGPASEPETRAVLEVLYRYQPKRVIHMHSAGKSEVVANDAARQLSEVLRQGRQLTLANPQSSLPAGSLEEFATTTLGAEVLTLNLATGDDWRSAALTHYPTLLAAAIPKVAQETLSVAQTARVRVNPVEENIAPSPFSSDVEITRLDRSGYEELPPPPQKPTW